MGRHEANKRRLRERLFSSSNRPVKSVKATRARRPKPTRAVSSSKRRSAKPAISFLFTGALLMVTIVDPYSGNMAMAGILYAYGPNSPGFPQDYTYSSPQKFTFDRGGFTLVTGGSRNALFVDLAAKPDPGTAKAIAYDYVTRLGWNQAQYSCLVSLWTRESNWRVNAYNAGSGAYGIPQALPGVKMASVADDWQTNPTTQIRWGVTYITRRYVTGCSALAHSDQFGWY